MSRKNCKLGNIHSFDSEQPAEMQKIIDA